MKIKELPSPIKGMALVNQKNQGNELNKEIGVDIGMGKDNNASMTYYPETIVKGLLIKLNEDITKYGVAFSGPKMSNWLKENLNKF